MGFLERFFGKDQSKPALVPSPPPIKLPEVGPLPEFPYPLIEVNGAEALEAWNRYQALWRKEGCSAVLLGNVEEVVRMSESFELNGAVEATLEAAKTITPESFRSRLLQEDSEIYGEEDGDWPGSEIAPMQLTAHLEIGGGKPKLKVYLARIPTAKSFEIPAYLKFGAWNACPAPEDHVALMRDWDERYGVEIYAITGDVVECEIKSPPATHESALALAREQFFYCDDIVYQGVGSISALAATLQNSNAWYFWWD